jgi:hypothetical protein
MINAMKFQNISKAGKPIEALMHLKQQQKL